MLNFKLLPAVAALALAFLAPSTVNATEFNYVTNGDFETLVAGNSLGAAGGYFCKAGPTCFSNVGSWSSICHAGSTCGGGGTPDALLFAGTAGSAFNGNIGLYALGSNGTTPNTPVPNSPTGGNFVAFDGDPAFNASISQTITGLTPGRTYMLSFWQGAAQQSGTNGATTEQWQVTFATQTRTSTLMNNVDHGWVAWNQQSMNFTVSNSSTGTEVLTFLALGGPGGLPPVVLLDGVTMTALPEPGAMSLAGAGLCALSLVARLRRRKG